MINGVVSIPRRESFGHTVVMSQRSEMTDVKWNPFNHPPRFSSGNLDQESVKLVIIGQYAPGYKSLLCAWIYIKGCRITFCEAMALSLFQCLIELVRMHQRKYNA